MMLSATQSKYYLHKSLTSDSLDYLHKSPVSQNINYPNQSIDKSTETFHENINYIYYFTYFHEYKTHPLWEEFDKEFNEEFEIKIRDSVEGLGKSVDDFYESFFELYNNLDDLDSNLTLLLYRINRIRNRVETSIVNLKSHIKEQLEENKHKIQQSVRVIECIIKFILSCLKPYILEQTNCISQQLEDLKTVFTVLQWLNCKLKTYITKSKIRSILDTSVSDKTSVEQISNIIDNICPIYFVYVYLMKFAVRRTLSLTDKVYPNATKLFKFYLNTTRSALYFIKCKLTELLNLGYNILNLTNVILGLKKLEDFQKDIQGLDEHKKKLETDQQTLISYLKTFEDIGTDIKNIYDLKDKLPKLSDMVNMAHNLQSLFRLYQSIEKLNSGIAGIGRVEFLFSLKSSLYIEDNSALQTTDKKMEYFRLRLNEAMGYLGRYLDHHKTNLSTFKFNLEPTMCEFDRSLCSFVSILNQVKIASHRISSQFKGRGTEDIRKCLETYGKLKDDKITEFLSRLKGNIKSIAIKQIDKEFMDLIEIDFCRHNIYSTKRVIKNLLTVYISKLTTYEIVDALEKIEQIKLSLYNVQEFKKKVKEIEQDLQKLKENNTGIQGLFSLTKGSVNSPKLCKDKVKEVDDFLKPFEQQLNKLEESKNWLQAELKRIETELNKLKPMEDIKTKYGIKKLREMSLFKNYGVIAFKIDSLIEHKPNILKHKPKVDCEMDRLENEINALKSAIDIFKRQLEIFDDINKKSLIEIPLKICLIRYSVSKIKEEYQKYTEKFKAFKEALNKLETCLDYLIRDFLVCSVCTTVCRLKRQLSSTTWECPDSDCNSCLRHSLLGDTVTKVEQQLYGYSRLVFGHFTAVDTKVFISKLYRCIVRVDDIVGIVQVVDCCKCVKGFKDRIKSDNTDRTDSSENTNHSPHRMKTYRQYVESINSKDETQLNPGRQDTLADIDNSLNHLCLCLAIRHKLYPCLLKTVTILVQLELGVSGNIAKKFGTHSKYNLYYKQSRCNSFNLSVTTMLLLATWAFIKLAAYLDKRYKIEHDKVKCCTNDKGDSKCECQCKKNGGSSPKNCCPCCKCGNNNGSTSSTGTSPASGSETSPTPAATPKQCCCGKGEGSKGCRQTGCNDGNSESSSSNCCCKCCCQCVCENKIKCKCTCEPEEHCFCSNCQDDCYYRWFIYVILYICHIVDDAFSLGYWEITKASQLLSNLLSRLDAVCYEADRRCVTVAGTPDATPAEAKPGEQTGSKPGTSVTDSSTTQVQAPTPTTIKVTCCLVCVNVKVVCVSYHLVCNVHKYFVKCKGYKEADKPDECKLEKIDCICNYKSTLVPGLALYVYEVVREFRLRLSTLLSVSVTRYKLELDSVSSYNRDLATYSSYKRQTGELSGDLTYRSIPKDDLNYVPYFYLMHPLHVTKFTELFSRYLSGPLQTLRDWIDFMSSSQTKITSFISGLTQIISKLGEIISTIKCIMEFLTSVDKKVKSTIQEIGRQIAENQKQVDKTNKEIQQKETIIKESISAIKSNIKSLNDSLKKHVEKRLGEINTELTNKKEQLNKQIDSVKGATSYIVKIQEGLSYISLSLSTLQNFIDPFIDSAKRDETTSNSVVKGLNKTLQIYGTLKDDAIRKASEKFKKNEGSENYNEVYNQLQSLIEIKHEYKKHYKPFITSLLMGYISNVIRKEKDTKLREELEKIKDIGVNQDVDTKKNTDIRDSISKVNGVLHDIKGDINTLSNLQGSLIPSGKASYEDLEDFGEKIEELQAYIAKLDENTKQISTKKKQIDTTIEQIETSLQTLEHAKRELDSLEGFTDLGKPVLNKIQSTIGSLTSFKSELDKHKSKVDSAVSELQEQITSYKTYIGDTVNPKLEQFNAIKAEIQKLEQAKSGLDHNQQSQQQKDSVEQKEETSGYTKYLPHLTSIGGSVDALLEIKELTEVVSKPQDGSSGTGVTPPSKCHTSSSTTVSQVTGETTAHQAIDNSELTEATSLLNNVKGCVPIIVAEIQLHAVLKYRLKKLGEDKETLSKINEGVQNFQKELKEKKELLETFNSTSSQRKADITTVKSELENIDSVIHKLKQFAQKLHDLKDIKSNISELREYHQQLDDTLNKIIGLNTKVNKVIENRIDTIYTTTSNTGNNGNYIDSVLKYVEDKINKNVISYYVLSYGGGDKDFIKSQASTKTKITKAQGIIAELKPATVNLTNVKFEYIKGQATRESPVKPVGKGPKNGVTGPVTSATRGPNSGVNVVPNQKSVEANKDSVSIDKVNEFRRLSSIIASVEFKIESVVRDFIGCSLESLRDSLSNQLLQGNDYLKVRHMLSGVLKEVTSELSKSISCHTVCLYFYFITLNLNLKLGV